jgi:uncharacterized protein (TIGR03067 family)
MKFVGALFIALSLIVSAAAQDAGKESKMLEGVWIPSAAELSGQAFPEATLKTMKLIVEGDKYSVTVGKTVDKGTVKIDQGKKPKAMDIVGNDGPNKDKTYLAIYELDGDTLRVCYDLSGKTRPSEFKTTKESAHFLVTYKRAKS